MQRKVLKIIAKIIDGFQYHDDSYVKTLLHPRGFIITTGYSLLPLTRWEDVHKINQKFFLNHPHLYPLEREIKIVYQDERTVLATAFVAFRDNLNVMQKEELFLSYVFILEDGEWKLISNHINNKVYNLDAKILEEHFCESNTINIFQKIRYMERAINNANSEKDYSRELFFLSDELIFFYNVDNDVVTIWDKGHEKVIVYDIILSDEYLGNLSLTKESIERLKRYQKRVLDGTMQRGDTIDFTIHQRNANKEKFWHVHGVYLINAVSGIKQFIGKLKDITVMTYLEDSSIHDSLTHLFNRKYIQEHAERYIKRHGKNTRYALIIFDIDNFKNINDTYGHPVGDIALFSVSEAMRDICTADMIPARLGGDEFTIFVMNVVNYNEIEIFVQRLGELITSYTQASYKDLNVSISTGISRIYSKTQVKFSELYKEADKALYIVKKTSKNNYNFYSNLKGEKLEC